MGRVRRVGLIATASTDFQLEERMDKIRITEDNWGRFEKRIGQLGRRAVKIGVAPPTFIVTGAGEMILPSHETTETHLANACFECPRIGYRDVFITGDGPKLPGWRFIGKVERSPVEGLNLVSTIGTDADLSEFRTAPLDCDHCEQNRRRKWVFLIQDTDTGAVFKVGKSCLKDFTGHASPESAARYAETFFALDDEIESWGCGGDPRWPLAAMVSMACAITEAYGWRKADCDWDQGLPTKVMVMDALDRRGFFAIDRRDPHAPTPPKIESRHRDEAQAAIDWIASLDPDPVVLRDDYLFKLRLCCEADEYGLAYSKHIGLIASLPGAYRRHLANEEKRTKAAQEREAAQPIPEFDGRAQIEGTVKSAKWRVTDFGETLKVLIEHADGWRVWGTCPRAIEQEVGGEVDELMGKRLRFTARIAVSDDDAAFGFFSRPTKPEMLSA